MHLSLGGCLTQGTALLWNGLWRWPLAERQESQTPWLSATKDKAKGLVWWSVEAVWSCVGVEITSIHDVLQSAWAQTWVGGPWLLLIPGDGDDICVIGHPYVSLVLSDLQMPL